MGRGMQTLDSWRFCDIGICTFRKGNCAIAGAGIWPWTFFLFLLLLWRLVILYLLLQEPAMQSGNAVLYNYAFQSLIFSLLYFAEHSILHLL